MPSQRDRWFIYREQPFRPLYEGGLGFQPPPSRIALSAMPRAERKRWHVWEFTDRNLARALVLSCNKARPGANYARMSDFARVSHGQAPLAPPSAKAQRRAAKGKVQLDDLA